MTTPSGFGLVTNITQITLFGEDVDLLPPAAGPPPPIVGYVGQQLFITKVEVQNGVLVVTIDDVGPPACAPAALTSQPTGATALFSYGNKGALYYPTTTTSAPPNYNGGPLVLTANVVPDSITFQPDTKPVVAPWSAPKGDLCFVLVNAPNSATKLVWLTDDIDIKQPTHARVVPKATGGSSLGPFGLETG